MRAAHLRKAAAGYGRRNEGPWARLWSVKPKADTVRRVDYEPAAAQPHPPPQHPPAVLAVPVAVAAPPSATVDSSFTVSGWPPGHSAGAPDSLIGRLTSKVLPQARQRYS